MKEQINIKPKEGILLIKKYSRTALKSDIIVDEGEEEDRNLIAGEVLSAGDADYPQGITVIFGKYAVFKLILKSEEHYFLDKTDIIGVTNYKEV